MGLANENHNLLHAMTSSHATCSNEKNILVTISSWFYNIMICNITRQFLCVYLINSLELKLYSVSLDPGETILVIDDYKAHLSSLLPPPLEL